MDVSTYTVAELARIVGQAVARAFPDEVWVHGEIRDLSRPSSGHVYFTLVDSEPEEKAASILPVTLFATDKLAVNRLLSRSGAVRMTDGVEVRIRGRVSHYAARGMVQLRMTWIDPDFTLGKMAADRDRLVKSLAKQGLLERNQAIPLPLVPLRIGLVTSVGSAAHADFGDELERSGFAWKVQLFDARVQGPDAVAEVAQGIAVLGSSGLDAVAVIRGGGAQTDLVAFDSEEVALAIAHCPVPVLTGIGHEIDVSVADLVARDFKTPTACAGGLVDHVSSFVDQLDRLASNTAHSVKRRLGAARHELNTATERLSRSSYAAGTRAGQTLTDLGAQVSRTSRHRLRREAGGVSIAGARIARIAGRQLVASGNAVDRLADSIGTEAVRATATASNHVADLEHRLGLLDPARLLAKGWSITRTAAGDLVTSPAAVGIGTALSTTLAGGQIESVVTETEDVNGG